MKVREALAAATVRLADGSASPRLDAELLIAHALGMSREEMLLRHLDDPAPPAFGVLVARRGAGEPVAYLVGVRDFWAITLEVGPGVLIPRPDSETLIEAAVAHFGAAALQQVLDLGTGPGTLLLAALAQWPEARGLGVDASETALAYARRNAERLGLAGRAEFKLGNWTDGLSGPFDLILCNPPYVETGAALPREVSEWEPREALFAGPDGLDDYRRLAPRLRPLLAPGGAACIEIGAGQCAAVTALLVAEGLSVESRKDLAGIDRCIIAKG